MIKFNEAQSIGSTYEHIVKRLKDERTSFDNQLTALENTSKAKQRDHDELLLISGNANHARDVAQHELNQTRSSYEEKREKRDVELRERQQVVRIRTQMIEKQERREAKKRDLLMENALGLEEVDGSTTSRYKIGSARSSTDLDYDKIIEEQESKLNVYERAFRKIKEATGVSDVNDVIEKINGQEKTTKSLIGLIKQNQGNIDKLLEMKNQRYKDVEDVKYNGNLHTSSRKQIDAKEEQLSMSHSKLESWRNKHDRSTNTLINAKAGVKHIHGKVDAIHCELQGYSISFDESTLADILWSAGNVLVEVLARTKEGESYFHFKDNVVHKDKSEWMNVDSESGRLYNQRVSLPSTDNQSVELNNSCDDDHGEIDEEEISRDKVKKASSQIVQIHQRKKAKEKEKLNKNK